MDYEVFKIKSFKLWDLYLHKEQFPYPGRCYAAAIRAEADNILAATTDEVVELFSVITPLWFNTVKTLYRADWPNVAILGNDWRHLHAHLIPRYYQPVTAHGIEFTDPQPTKNYAPYPKKELGMDTLMKIRNDISNALDRTK